MANAMGSVNDGQSQISLDVDAWRVCSNKQSSGGQCYR